MKLELFNKSTIEVKDEDAKLSVFLQTILKNDTAFERIKNALTPKKFQKFEKFISTEQRLYLNKYNCSNNSCDDLKIFINEQIANEFPHLQNQFTVIFCEALIHKLTFIKDNTMLLVVKFLSLEDPNKNPNMFDELPMLVRTKNIESIDKWEMYYKFIQDVNMSELCELASAATTLEIEPLIYLTGCKMAEIVNSFSEEEVRKLFNIPPEFKNAALEKLAALDPLLALESFIAQR